jgi:protein-S-isoprenylcysteine O-methyltransferase Ste14
VPDLVFRVVLPLFWLLLGIDVAIVRWRLRRALGRDPIVTRPWRNTNTPGGYLERVLFTCALVLAADTFLNALSPDGVADALGIEALRMSNVVGSAGLALLTTGVLLAAVAVKQMGSSWRMGIDRHGPGPVVSRGLFARVRHPIYGGMLLAASGIAAVTADLFSVAAAGALWVGLPVQARLEEAFLSSQFPDEYPAYQQHTGTLLAEALLTSGGARASRRKTSLRAARRDPEA